MEKLEGIGKMDSFIEVQNGVHVIKDKLFGYRLVHPIKNKDGTINWFNLFTGGSWGNLIMVIVICAFLVSLVIIYKNDVSQLVECCNSACDNLVSNLPDYMNTQEINFSNIKV